jgi:hypothetical protein
MDFEVSKNDLILPPKNLKISPKITIYPFWKDIWKVQVGLLLIYVTITLIFMFSWQGVQKPCKQIINV